MDEMDMSRALLRAATLAWDSGDKDAAWACFLADPMGRKDISREVWEREMGRMAGRVAEARQAEAAHAAVAQQF